MIFLKLNWQYLQRNVARVGTLVEMIESALKGGVFPTLSGGEELDDDLREVLGHGAKRCDIDIPDPWKSAEWGHATSVESFEALVESLLVGADLNYL